DEVLYAKRDRLRIRAVVARTLDTGRLMGARSSVTKHPTAPLPVANEKPWATKDGIASAAWQSPRRPCGRFAMTVCLVL
ncbi:MAG: hypothetical protein ACXWC1_16125, partial [Burkholderiales bacterium]